MKKAEKTVEWVEHIEYPDEGHGFAIPKDRLDFHAKVEKLFSQNREVPFPIPGTPLGTVMMMR